MLAIHRGCTLPDLLLDIHPSDQSQLHYVQCALGSSVPFFWHAICDTATHTLLQASIDVEVKPSLHNQIQNLMLVI